MGKSIHGLPSGEKLKSRKDIGQIFLEKTSVFKFPINCLYQKAPDNDLPKITAVASKRNFKKAVDRNKIKRKIREAYRLNKAILTDTNETRELNLVFVYVGREILSFQEIEKSMIHILNTLSRTITNN